MNKIFEKQRQREAPTFANINLLGKCNADCFFCLGKDLSEYIDKFDMNSVHFREWLNFNDFILKCTEEGITNLYITGQNTDALLYKYLDELIDYLHSKGFQVGIRTNGFLALQKMDIVNKCTRSVGYSIHSLNPIVNKIILGRKFVPEWDLILSKTIQSRVAIVVNQFNVGEFENIVKFISDYPNVKYIQARRISTDLRQELMLPHVEIYEELYQRIASTFRFKGLFYDAEVYDMFGKDVVFWRTIKTTVNSWNYFVDGTISRMYFIVEGYLKNRCLTNTANSV